MYIYIIITLPLLYKLFGIKSLNRENETRETRENGKSILTMVN